MLWDLRLAVCGNDRIRSGVMLDCMCVRMAAFGVWDRRFWIYRMGVCIAVKGGV
jgi:hypothetical protein